MLISVTGLLKWHADWMRLPMPHGEHVPPAPWGFPLGTPIHTDGVEGMPCSDCCHARFGPVTPGAREITANWPCMSCGRVIGEVGGYHHRQTCDTDLNAP